MHYPLYVLLLNYHDCYSIFRYLYKFQEPIPVEQAVKSVCDYKHSYTQYGGLRPFGVSFLFAGWDKHYGYQLYQSDPSGNYSGWKATVIGNQFINYYFIIIFLKIFIFFLRPKQSNWKIIIKNRIC